MRSFFGWLVLAVVGLGVLASAAPALGRLSSAALPLVLAIGGLRILMRIVRHWTSRY